MDLVTGVAVAAAAVYIVETVGKYGYALFKRSRGATTCMPNVVFSGNRYQALFHVPLKKIALS